MSTDFVRSESEGRCLAAASKLDQAPRLPWLPMLPIRGVFIFRVMYLYIAYPFLL